MLCERCKEHESAYVVEYKDPFFPEEICEHCLDKDGEEIYLVITEV